MSAYSYKALDERGKIVSGMQEGDSERQVRQQLRGRKLKPIEVALAGDKPARSPLLRWRQPRISPSELALLTRQLATLVQSGMPLDESLQAAAQQARKARSKSLLLQVRSRVLEGHSLAYALGDFPAVFDEMYCAMVKAGEHAGFLATVLEQLADYTETRQFTRQKLKSAMIYPLVLVLLSIAVIAVLMVFVVPDLVGVFAHSNQQLPALTRGVIALSNFFSHYWWSLILAALLLPWLIAALLAAPQRRYRWHRLLLRLPLIAGFVTAVDTARFASTLSILSASGVPLLDGLRIAGAVLNNLALRRASQSVAVAVKEGGSLHRALEQSGVFPPMMVHMVASGEASGELESMLARSAQNQERELEMTLNNLMAVFEPLMIIVMAAIVSCIVFAILLPIIEMNNLLG